MSNTHSYTTEDIRMYLEGKLSASEMHAIEKAAMEDPFLADALEGMEIMKDNKRLAEFEEHSRELKERFAANIRKRQKAGVRSIYNAWSKVAAVLVMIVTGLVVVLMMNEKTQVHEARVAKKETGRETVRVIERAYIGDTAAKKKTAKTSKNSNNKKVDPSPTPEANEVQLQSTQKDLASESRAAKADVPAAGDDTVLQRNVQGKVAGIAIKKDEETVSANRVIKTSEEINQNSHVEPVGGWLAFEKYIDSAKTVNPPDSVTHGAVKLTFIINRKGRPARINVVTSLSPAHDERAVKLLELGPSWKVLRGKTRKVTLLMKF